MKRLRDIVGYLLGAIIFIGLIPAVMWLLSGSPALAVHIGAIRATITGILIIGGLSLSVWTIVYMKNRGKGNPMDAFGKEIGTRTQHLMTDGPYRFNRNPMLTGTLTYLMGFVIWFWTWQSAVVWVVFFVIMFVQVLTEERRLKRDFGDEYDRYCRTTRRF